MSTQHTPGPWSTDESEIYAGDVMIAETLPVANDPSSGGRFYGDIELANAHLIAAAPDLLEAAREGLICAEADLEAERLTCLDHGEDPEQDQFVQVFRQRRDLIRAAIAKAGGPV
jgi:hypothetical protein